ncbi:MAG: hypothetical protein KDI43_12795 [Gammaproteobacteria bacterium]|nr:hypothetical protein [Gammaproteobacteria bacterium]
MKFLVSLINNCRQPARRSGIAVSDRQTAAPFTQPHPAQEDSSLRMHEQTSQPAPYSALKNTKERASDHVENRPIQVTGESKRVTPQVGESAPKAEAEGRMGTGEPPMNDDPAARPLMRSEPDTAAADAERLQTGAAEAATGSRETPLPGTTPAFPAGRAYEASLVSTARDSLSAPPGPMRPAAAEIPLLAAGAQVMAPQPPVDSLTPGTENKSAANPPQAATLPIEGRRAAQQPASESAGESSAAGPRSHGQAATPPRMQAVVQPERAEAGNTSLRHSVKRDQPPEIPQVRIGQINVVVEDQTPARPRQNRRSVRPSASNPFGLRGL